MKSRKRSYIKRFVAYAVMFAMILGICPQTQKQQAKAASTYAVSLNQLGKLGAFKAGSKGKGSNDNWWKMTVNGKPTFCLNLGLTCHSGDTYEEKSSGTYKSHGSGEKDRGMRVLVTGMIRFRTGAIKPLLWRKLSAGRSRKKGHQNLIW